MYRILIADDEIKIRETLSDYLTAKGFDVTLAKDGEAAVCCAENESFDLKSAFPDTTMLPLSPPLSPPQTMFMFSPDTSDDDISSPPLELDAVTLILFPAYTEAFIFA